MCTKIVPKKLQPALEKTRPYTCIGIIEKNEKVMDQNIYGDKKQFLFNASNFLKLVKHKR